MERLRRQKKRADAGKRKHAQNDASNTRPDRIERNDPLTPPSAEGIPTSSGGIPPSSHSKSYITHSSFPPHYLIIIFFDQKRSETILHQSMIHQISDAKNYFWW
jgi:hypothetical protein